MRMLDHDDATPLVLRDHRDLRQHRSAEGTFGRVGRSDPLVEPLEGQRDREATEETEDRADEHPGGPRSGAATPLAVTGTGVACSTISNAGG